jgi:hypothetical protein
MNSKQMTDGYIKQIILDTVKKQEPETTMELIDEIQAHHKISFQKIISQIIELENEGRLLINKQEPPTKSYTKTLLLSRKAFWYWGTISLVLVTCLAVFFIPDSSQFLFVRFIFAVVFLLFLPGYTLIKLLYPEELPMKAASEDIDKIERVALSFGLSLVLTPLIGLAINYTPYGVTLAPITLSLLALTLIFATAALLRELLVNERLQLSKSLVQTEK